MSILVSMLRDMFSSQGRTRTGYRSRRDRQPLNGLGYRPSLRPPDSPSYYFFGWTSAYLIKGIAPTI